MKKVILPSFLILAFAATTQAQSKTFAITSAAQGNYFWSDIRQVDLSTGQVVKAVYETDKTGFQAFDATSKKAIVADAVNNYNSKPFAYGVAAAAYDKRHDRLYFTPMHIAQVRYIDMSSGESKFFYLQDKMLDNPNGYLSEENHITRMVIVNKTGYAITNDGNHVFSFTTGKKPTVTDLGALVDDPANNGISIRNKCTSWGGDLVGTTDGNLYLVSANRHVFSINPETLVARHLGAIKGIPGNITANGVVVSDEGQLLMASASANSGYYSINPETLEAKALPFAPNTYSTSDLANANLLNTRKAGGNETTPVETSKIPVPLVLNNSINVYPNPVTGSQFKINFDELQKGWYNVSVTDLSGRTLLNKRVNVQNESQVETINLDKQTARGIYLVKIADAANTNIYTGKLVIE
ncbi:MAG: T9SS type A sorting domain-containing protein [Dinghuibacter sp.]|nr:T9SS type A sorting domain-containing protein [Dinghuibacter sp.]